MTNRIRLQNEPGEGKTSKGAMLDVIKSIQDYSYNHLKKAGVRSIVLGISGGVDSALTAALLRPVADRLGIPLIGRYIGISTNSSEELDRAVLIGEFCTDFAIVDLGDMFDHVRAIDDNESVMPTKEHETKVRLGNIKARMRMMTLYNLASRTGGLVLSTDNLSELNIGFWTLHGDVGDFGPIQKLWKTEVYALTDFIQQNFIDIYGPTVLSSNAMYGLIQCIDADATDGLGITTTDLDQITDKEFTSSQEGYKYVDDVLIAFLNNPLIVLDGKIIARHLATDFKRAGQVNVPRFDIFN